MSEASAFLSTSPYVCLLIVSNPVATRKIAFLPSIFSRRPSVSYSGVEEDDFVIRRKTQVSQPLEELVLVLREVRHDFRVQIELDERGPVVVLEAVRQNR